ncbi:MAG TPA: hypothetical protein VMI54_13385 [Polyangiaceae bacterium]|nr:hypothetical protein [Polyangiaceae bacterium]
MRRSQPVTQPPDAPPEAEHAATLTVGETFAGRFRVEEEVGEALGGGFYGVDTTTGKKVVLVPIPVERERTLAPLLHLVHAHLAPLLELEPLGDQFVAVAATVEGETLAERLDAIGKKPAVDAVRSALRLADALSHVHEAGGAHGWVNPHAVVVEPSVGAEPQLALGVRPDLALKTPERAPEGTPTIADDTWATAALLHWMLTGKPPPEHGYADAEGLEKAGVTDPALRAALFHTLTASRPDRQSDLRPLRRELARWFVDHAGEEPIAPSHRQTAPPPLPPSVRPPSRRPPSKISVPPPPKGKVGTFAIVAVVLGAAAGIGLTFLRPKRVQIVPVPEKEVVAAPTSSALELGEVPVTAEDDVRLGSKLATCVAGYMPKGTFAKTPDVEWLCPETDPREGAEKLRVALVSAAPKGTVTEAMKIFSRIGWYAMPAFAVVRAGCCPDAKPIALPEEHCAMSTALRDVGDAVVAAKDVTEPLKKYTETIHCELNHGGAKMLRRAERPQGGEDTAFLELVKPLE